MYQHLAEMMKSIAVGVLCVLGSYMPLHAQTAPTWETLENAPRVGRYNDVFFATPDSGWVVNGDGEIYRTVDGGATWRLQVNRPRAHFRSVAFVDAQRGWAGNVGPGEFGATDPTILYQTTNAGINWLPVTTFEGPVPAGMCGMHAVNDSTVVGVGRVRGPAFFVRTTDGGKTWTSRDMSSHAAGLIDVYFTDTDTGFAVGLTNADHDQSSGVVLYTADGGATWEERFRTSRTGEWFWKLSFPSPRVGYASLQRNSSAPIFFAKTSDGGATWEEKLFSQSYYFVQGIGFATEDEGWIGGNSSSPTFHTTDGGETWVPDPIGARLNRFRFLNDSLGYAVGRQVHKFAPASRVHAEGRSALPATVRMDAGYPNPFRAATTVQYSLPTPAFVVGAVYDVQGRRVVELVRREQPAGTYSIVWDGTDEVGETVSTGVYFFRISVDAYTRSRPMVIVR